MSYLGIPFLGALSHAIGVTLERTILKKRKVHIKTYLVAVFLGVVLIMLPFIYFFWNIDSGAFELKNIIIFIIIILFSIIANLFFFYSLKWEKVTYTEPARMLEPLFIIIFALIFSFIVGTHLYQRNLDVVIPSLIAGITLVLTHLKKHHLTLNKYFISAILGSLFFALELVITKLILNFYDPITFYFIRALSVVIVSLVIFKPKFKKIEKRVKGEIFAVAFFWVIFRVSVYYGYIYLGVIFTTLIIMLGPIFIYILAWKFLKEKLNKRNLIAAIVILGCVIYTSLSEVFI